MFAMDMFQIVMVKSLDSKKRVFYYRSSPDEEIYGWVTNFDGTSYEFLGGSGFFRC